MTDKNDDEKIEKKRMKRRTRSIGKTRDRKEAE